METIVNPGARFRMMEHLPVRARLDEAVAAGLRNHARVRRPAERPDASATRGRRRLAPGPLPIPGGRRVMRPNT